MLGGFQLLTPGFAEDDVVLEAVIVIGTLAIDPASAPMMANLRLIRLLFDVMNGMCTLTSTPFSDLGQFGLLLFVGEVDLRNDLADRCLCMQRNTRTMTS